MGLSLQFNPTAYRPATRNMKLITLASALFAVVATAYASVDPNDPNFNPFYCTSVSLFVASPSY